MPTVPAGSGERLEMASGAPCGMMVRLSCWVTVPAAVSTTLTVMVVVPAVVGVPVMTPDGSRVNPSGKGFEPGLRLHVYSGMPPLAVKV